MNMCLWSAIIFYNNSKNKLNNLSFPIWQSYNSILEIPNLESNTLYYISLAYILDSNHEFFSVSNLKEFKTLQTGYIPMDITKVRFGDFQVNKYNNSLVDTEVLWAPALGEYLLLCMFQISKFYFYYV
jgi:hypothetical protein